MNQSNKIVYISDAGVLGFTPKDMVELRADISWLKTLHMFHVPLAIAPNNLKEINEADFVIINYPKLHEGGMNDIMIHLINEITTKKGFIQHGSYDYFMSWSTKAQKNYIDLIRKSDFFIITNIEDYNKFALLAKETPILYLPTDLDDDIVQKIKSPNRRKDKTLIGGNMTQWYAGTLSLLIAEKLGYPITIPSMGNRHQDETQYVREIVSVETRYLPYMRWTDWFRELSEHKYAVNMMPVAACGSFAVACASLGIPCIGREHITAQRICFPELCVNENYDNIDEIVNLVKTDYARLGQFAREQYKKYFERNVVKEMFLKQLKSLKGVTKYGA